MTQTVPPNLLRPDSPRPGRVVRVTPDLHLAAAERLVSHRSGDIGTAARQLVASAPTFGIDLSMAWVTLNESWTGKSAKTGVKGSLTAASASVPRVRQACLAVPGSGRTAMFFISEPWTANEFGDPALARLERAACIDAACNHMATLGGRVNIAQALPDPTETWAIEAFQAASFQGVGTLGYLRREPGPMVHGKGDGGGGGAAAEFEPWPAGVEVVRSDEFQARLKSSGGGSGTIGLDRAVMQALDRSYIDTLDCPELCGLRETADVLASHRSTGTYEPTLWWLVLHNGVAEGCMLLNPCPDQHTVELVYLGLGPALRGKGLGRRLLTMGVSRARTLHPSWSVTCAVDERNQPAIRLYDALGFRQFGQRVALVRAIRA